MTNQAEAERSLGLISGQPNSSVKHCFQGVTFGQFAFLGGNATGDFLQLVTARKVVLDYDHELLQLGRDVHYRR